MFYFCGVRVRIENLLMLLSVTMGIGSHCLNKRDSIVYL